MKRATCPRQLPMLHCCSGLELPQLTQATEVDSQECGVAARARSLISETRARTHQGRSHGKSHSKRAARRGSSTTKQIPTIGAQSVATWRHLCAEQGANGQGFGGRRGAARRGAARAVYLGKERGAFESGTGTFSYFSPAESAFFSLRRWYSSSMVNLR
eukprot:Amastigsp_a178205_10.p1 type:complete len:159 gc:universal Amastigsp_a178205_10:2-478(+)